MQATSQIIKDYSYRNKFQRSSIAIVKEEVSALEADEIIKDCQDLIDDPKFTPFFYKKLYQHGKSRFLEAAHKARKYGKHGKGRFFCHLLK